MSTPKFTPGPWRWELNKNSKVIELCGGRPQFDKTVMDFERWGMGGAAPRFQDPADQHLLLTRAEHFAVVVPGREHHRSWFQGIDQPDANLIAAAPELYYALAGLVADIERVGPESWVTAYVGLHRVHAALAKAEGAA